MPPAAASGFEANSCDKSQLVKGGEVSDITGKRRGSRRANEAVVEGVDELTEIIGLVAACECLGIARSSYYYLVDPPVREPKPRKLSPRRLSDAEREHILAVCHSERFCDVSVREIYATLLDEGIYLASVPTIYRILAEAGETRERRRQATHRSQGQARALSHGTRAGVVVGHF